MRATRSMIVLAPAREPFQDEDLGAKGFRLGQGGARNSAAARLTSGVKLAHGHFWRQADGLSHPRMLLCEAYEVGTRLDRSGVAAVG